MRIATLLPRLIVPGLLLIAGLFVAPAPARADMPIVWTLSGVALNGTPVTGSFTFDGTSFGAFYVSNDSVNGYNPNVYDSANGATVNVLSSSSFILYSPTYTNIQFDFLNPLDGSVSPDAISQVTSDVCGDGCIVSSTAGEASTVTVTGVPEPHSLALLGVGLAGLVVARRRTGTA